MHCASSPAAARAVFLARDRSPVDVGVEEAVFAAAHLQTAARIVPRAVVFLHALHLALHRPGRDSAGEESAAGCSGILCRILGEWVEEGFYPEDYDTLKEIVADISYNNAKRYFSFEEKKI